MTSEMGKWAVIFVWICFLSTQLIAQVGAGLTLGGVTSQIDGDSWGGYKKLGYSLGGYAWYSFNDRISLQPEILVGHRGSREVVDGYGQFSMNFIDIPVLLRLKAYQHEPFSLIVEGGPSANILLSAKNGFKNNKVDNTDFFSRLNAEAHLGLAGYMNDRFGLFLRWSVGLTNLWAFTPRPWMTIHYFTAGVRIGFIGQ